MRNYIMLVLSTVTVLSSATSSAIIVAPEASAHSATTIFSSANQVSSLYESNNNSNKTMTFFGAFGTSIVNGVRVVGVTMDEQNNQLNVTLKSNTTGYSPGVTVVAFEGNIDLNSAIAGQMKMMGNMANSNNKTDAMTFGNSNSGSIFSGALANATGGNLLAGSSNKSYDFGGSSFNPMSFIKNLKIGSNVVPQDMSSLHIVNLRLADYNSNSTIPKPIVQADTTFVSIVIIPYIGINNATRLQ